MTVVAEPPASWTNAAEVKRRASELRHADSGVVEREVRMLRARLERHWQHPEILRAGGASLNVADISMGEETIQQLRTQLMAEGFKVGAYNSTVTHVWVAFR